MTNYELESVINQKMKDGVIPGAVVLVEKGGEGRWLRAFGTSTGDVPVKTDDYCRVGSNTKTMTATVILQLMQEGKLKLDDPVSKYYSGVPNGETLTIEQLLEMRSGLPNYTYDPSFVKQPQKVWKPEELLALSFAKPVNFGPGARNRVLERELHRPGSHPREAHRDVRPGRVPEAHLRATRAQAHVAPGAHRQQDPRSACSRLHVPDGQIDPRQHRADAGPEGCGAGRDLQAERRHRLEPVAGMDRGVCHLDR